MRPRPILLLAAVLTGVAGAAIPLGSWSGDEDRRHAATVTQPPASKAGLRTSARVRGLLYPGVRRPLLVRISNLHRRAVTVTSLRVKVRRATQGCPRRSLRLSRFRGRTRVPARRRRVLRLRARLRPTAANACQDARFRLSVLARARETGQR